MVTPEIASKSRNAAEPARYHFSGVAGRLLSGGRMADYCLGVGWPTTAWGSDDRLLSGGRIADYCPVSGWPTIMYSEPTRWGAYHESVDRPMHDPDEGIETAEHEWNRIRDHYLPAEE